MQFKVYICNAVGGGGDVQFPEKRFTKVYNSMLVVISATRGSVGTNIQGKNVS